MLQSRTKQDVNRNLQKVAKRRYLVLMLRILLPVTALIIMAVLFYAINSSIKLNNFSITSLEVNDDKISIDNPEISSFATGGRFYKITAKRVEQKIDQLNKLNLIEPKGRITFKDNNEWFDFNADAGSFNRSDEIITFPGDLDFKTKSGISGSLANTVIEFRQRILTAKGRIHIDTQKYTIKSDSGVIDENKQIIVLSNGVDVIIKPDKNEVPYKDEVNESKQNAEFNINKKCTNGKRCRNPASP